MSEDRPRRAMWLLNHTAAREFEARMLREIGIEVFTPKIFPDDPNFRSASIDYIGDDLLTIPRDDLALLNASDWYSGASREAWEVANKHFDVAFFMLYRTDGVEAIQKNFKGMALWRTYGLSHGNTYSSIIRDHPPYQSMFGTITRFGERFWFAEAYEHLHEVEEAYLASRTVFLPLGMTGASEPTPEQWIGSDKRILFVCPDIGFNPIYTEIYRQFRKDFTDLPYAVAGAQSVRVTDDRVLGYLPLEEHRRNMREMRVMFYHSAEPRHIHFHPFEAVAAGMPLIFMAGGVLDRLGGRRLPGRCKSIREAKAKIRRVLNGDMKFISTVRESQMVLLEPMRPENCISYWRAGLDLVFQTLQELRSEALVASPRPRRIAVLTTEDWIDKAISVADLLDRGAAEGGEEVQIVIGVEERQETLSRAPRTRISHKIRHFRWERISHAHAKRAFAYERSFRPVMQDEYSAPNDKINYFTDCDAWLLVGARTEKPLLPIRPIIVQALAEEEGSRRRLQKLRTGANNEYDAQLVLVPDDWWEAEIVGCGGILPRYVRLVAPSAKQAAGQYWKAVSQCL